MAVVFDDYINILNTFIKIGVTVVTENVLYNLKYRQINQMSFVRNVNIIIKH